MEADFTDVSGLDVWQNGRSLNVSGNWRGRRFRQFENTESEVIVRC